MSRYTIYVLLILAAMFFVDSLDQYLARWDGAATVGRVR